MGNKVKILETFRDSIQGLDHFVPTEVKVEILKSMLHVGFDFLDIGSFVSPKVIPQFGDMENVIDKLNIESSKTKLFVLVANEIGANTACRHDKIDVLGFPFSTSESFLEKNIRSDFEKSWRTINEVQNISEKNGKTLMVYLAMAFGNPYGDPVNLEICHHWTEKLHSIGINSVHLSDVIGVSTPKQIAEYYGSLTHSFKGVEFGIHLHIKNENGHSKLKAAFDNGCIIYDGVISGLGGCPMTGYELLKNMPTTNLLQFLSSQEKSPILDMVCYNKTKRITQKLLITS